MKNSRLELIVIRGLASTLNSRKNLEKLSYLVVMNNPVGCTGQNTICRRRMQRMMTEVPATILSNKQLRLTNAV